MKAIKFLVCSLIIVFVVSCKNEKEAEKPVVDETFTITLNATVAKDDNFQVFYKESNDAAAPFEEKYSLFAAVPGGAQPQDIVFKLPEGVFPTQLRVDFGTNKEQSEIIVNKFKMSYKEKAFETNGTNFFDYFSADSVFVKVDKAASKATPFVTKEGIYDPMFISQVALNNEILKLAK